MTYFYVGLIGMVAGAAVTLLATWVFTVLMLSFPGAAP
jgi:hypothetical protein